MKKNILLIGLTGFLLILTSWTGSFIHQSEIQDDNDLNKLIAGSWVREGTTIKITFNEEGKYEVDFTGDGETNVWGTCEVKKESLIFNDEKGMASEFPGKYEWSLTEDKLTFTLINDPSDGRSSLLPGVWIRKSGKEE